MRKLSFDVKLWRLAWHSVSQKQVFLWIGFSLLATVLLEGMRVLAHSPFAWLNVAKRWLFSATLLLPFCEILPRPRGKSCCIWPWPSVFLMGMVGVAMVIYIWTNATWAAWGVLWGFVWLLLSLDACWMNEKCCLRRWGVRAILLSLSGGVPVVVAQIESRFSDEEFFVVLQALGMGMCWALLLAGRTLIANTVDNSKVQSVTRAQSQGFCLQRRWLVVGSLVLSLLGAFGTIRAYQSSFYPASVPSYPGITYETPFICGEVPPASQTFEGEDVFRRLLVRVEANPYKGPPEYGILALGTGKRDWAVAFRKSLLGEAAEQRFAGPAHSVKWIQYEAALRAYYFARVRARFPELFSEAEGIILHEWFANINRRALTVEWVDWMYALAFAKWPEGPYENQENGAGLLALLEAEDLTTPGLSPINRAYLARNQRGWSTRFRNTDDVFAYQLEWINNAYFQSLYTGEYSEDALRLSFEWLLLQALPDGEALVYNYPIPISLAGVAYLGADLLDDPRYLWLAGRALEAIEAKGGYLRGQPGIENSLKMIGQSPSRGSCLIYGDSGLPNQEGPLAPDKVVFRDNWLGDAAYLLLNLRFSGWHRYKATNTISLVYQGEPLAIEMLAGEAFSWLPEGRSLFRDKRVPRENLNGLLVERTGMGAALYILTGIGGPWAQDPPYYVEVLDFRTGQDVDRVHTRLEEWHGWQHDRWVYFYHHRGPIVIVDEAKGPSHRQAALVWHLAAVEGGRDPTRLRQQSTEVRLLPWQSDHLDFEIMSDSMQNYRAVIVSPTSKTGKLRLVTVFLMGDWVSAQAWIDPQSQLLYIVGNDEVLTLEILSQNGD